METLNNLNYPKNNIDFVNWYSSCIRRKEIYYNLGKPIPFDVSLRDGIQCLPSDILNIYTLEKKINLYQQIIFNYNPINLEIGAIVSPKLLPMMNNSLELLDYISKNINLSKVNNLYILVPNKDKFLNIIESKIELENINFSFITSVSESFQIKNTKKNLKNTKNDFKIICDLINDNIILKNKFSKNKIKLYISCINECPIEGKINNDIIVDEIIYYFNLKLFDLCLADTCGTLNLKDFEYIINKCKINNIILSTISLHLHIDNKNLINIENIFHKALDNGIKNFDVSLLDYGGCSITMKNMNNNLTYELYYKFLVNYINKKL